MSRNNARKSRFTDAFLDAKERLEMEFEHNSDSLEKTSKSFSNYKQIQIVLSPDGLYLETGVEVIKKKKLFRLFKNLFRFP